MANTTTFLEGMLKKCKTIRQCFEVQNALADGLTEEQELELRAHYAGLTVKEAKAYQDALRIVKTIEAKPHTEKNFKEMTNLICGFCSH